uniref:Uncharacterized protein n=1 Tax=Rhizophora mucronata TaxID=61149 RepID=A0A2P2NFE3_RHIMU
MGTNENIFYSTFLPITKNGHSPTIFFSLILNWASKP